MFMKKCFNCGEEWYSCNKKKLNKCDKCNTDLTNIPIQPSEKNNNIFYENGVCTAFECKCENEGNCKDCQLLKDYTEYNNKGVNNE